MLSRLFAIRLLILTTTGGNDMKKGTIPIWVAWILVGSLGISSYIRIAGDAEKYNNLVTSYRVLEKESSDNKMVIRELDKRLSKYEADGTPPVPTKFMTLMPPVSYIDEYSKISCASFTLILDDSTKWKNPRLETQLQKVVREWSAGLIGLDMKTMEGVMSLRAHEKLLPDEVLKLSSVISIAYWELNVTGCR